MENTSQLRGAEYGLGGKEQVSERCLAVRMMGPDGMDSSTYHSGSPQHWQEHQGRQTVVSLPQSQGHMGTVVIHMCIYPPHPQAASLTALLL